MKRKISFVCCAFLILFQLSAQVVNFPIQNFSPKEYGKNYNSQNLCVLQDKSDFMYFGNGNGILQYDGKSWQFIPVKKGAYVSSMALDSTGTIFIGSQSEFGYLKTDSYGKLKYHSLSSSLKDTDKEFGAIVKTYATNNAVIFQCQEKLFIYKKDRNIIVINSSSSFHTSFVVNNELYVRERKNGLLKLESNLLKPIKGGEMFAEMGIFSMLPYSLKGEILIATMEMGLWKYVPNTSNSNEIFTPIKTSNEELLSTAGLYGGIKLSDGNFAFNTLKMGTVIMNQYAQITSIINKEMGIRVNDVKQIFEDSQQNIWMALNNGISMVSYQSNLSYYSEESGLIGSIHAINKLGQNFFIGTSTGLFYRNDQNTSTNQYLKINGISNQIWSLIKHKETLVVGGDDGVFLLNDLNSKKVSNIKCRAIKYDSIKHIWLVGTEPSLVILDDNWQILKSLTDVNSDIISIELSNNNNNNITDVWAGTFQQGIFRVSIDGSLNTIVKWIGLPDNLSNECIYPLKFDNKIVFGTKSGVFSYSEKEGYKLNSLTGSFEFNEGVSLLYQNKNNIWISIDNKVVLLNKENGAIDNIPFLSIDKGQLLCFYQEGDVCWIGSDDGLIRYDVNGKKDYLNSFQTQIRKVNCGKDSIIYFGNETVKKKDIPILHLNYKLNSIYFEYSGLFFEDNSKNLYSFKLEGQDTIWSNWTNETKAVFTNLHEGHYTFKVKAKNSYGIVSNEASYSFNISSPWYRTWWAYAFYFLTSSLFVYGFIKSRTKKLIKEKEQLEKIVVERTSEVVKQKHLVEEKHKEITDSINYAERIQRSFLATKDLLDENLKDYFIFFKPKDVVSGDFYWANKLFNGHFALVTADSTGHGVPGAIMSLLNIMSLEKAIEQHTEPAEIFNAARKTIIERLKKDGSAEGGKDGMDATMTLFDFKNKKIVISAANNPVWIVRGTETIEIKADKMPVGKHDRQDISFTQQEVQLQSGDVVYTLTDGFPDQFGGEKGKKFMSKNLRELLTENAHLPMQQQKQILEITFTNWVGRLEQIDDITVIGIRV